MASTALDAASDPQPTCFVGAARVAERIRSILVDTGDDIGTVARGLDVEPTWALDVITGKLANVDIDHVQRLCESLHCSPYDLLGADAARSIEAAYGPELWPRYIEPLEPIGWYFDDLDDDDERAQRPDNGPEVDPVEPELGIG